MATTEEELQGARKRARTEATTTSKADGDEKNESPVLKEVDGATLGDDKKGEKKPDSGAEVVDDSPPKIKNGVVDFSLSEIHDSLVCSLCSGYFRDPYTITECLHTFCKACLHYAVACGCHECPECKVYLGNDVPKFAVLDHALQELIDRVIFPSFAQKEKDSEKHFYESRGFLLRPEHDPKLPGSRARKGASAADSSSKASEDAHGQIKDGLEFTLLPEAHAGDKQLPVLECPFLRISGKFRMNQLKKYLLQKLPGEIISSAMLEILCNGVPLGDEISLSFVERLLWPHSSVLALTYRLADDEFEG